MPRRQAQRGTRPRRRLTLTLTLTRALALTLTLTRRSAELGLDYDCQFAKPAASRAGCKDVAILLDPQAG